MFRSLAIWGGIERVLVEKMNYLVTTFSEEIYMLTTDQGQHPVAYPLNDDVHFEDLDIRFHQQYRYSVLQRLWKARQLRRLFEQRLAERISHIQPDVVVCTTADPVASIVKVKGDIPLIVESHSIFTRTFGEKGIRQRCAAWLLKKGLKKTACVVALTEGDAVEWRKVHHDVRVIPDMVHLGSPSDEGAVCKRVIFVGRLDYQKRVMDIIDIWQRVHPHFPDWQLDIYGEGEQQAEAERMACALNMNVNVHKPTQQIFDCYRESTFLVSVSLFEPFGMVIPEAMSCGLPVIAYDCPYGPADIITDGVDGFLIAQDDKQMFADRMCQLMADENLRRQMGEAAVLSAQRYSAERIMPQWKQLFEEIIH